MDGWSGYAVEDWRGYVVLLSASLYNEAPTGNVLVAPISRTSGGVYSVELGADDPVEGHIRLTDVFSAPLSELTDPLAPLCSVTQELTDMELRLLLDL